MLQRLKLGLLLIVSALVLMLMLAPVYCYAIDNFMSVDQLKPGMKGIGRTVISGTKLEEFNVEILDILKKQGPSGDLITVKVSGELINKTSGIIQGMSGSPVYINGKLIGAIAYGWGFTDHRIGIVTPIKDMLKIWDIQEQLNPAKGIFSNAKPQLGANSVSELSTPLMASGFGEQTMCMLADKLKSFNMTPYAVGTTSPTAGAAPLQPGSAIGVELIRGDASLAAIGTVTYIDRNRLLAFGHPFRKIGNANYFLSTAFIIAPITSLENGFKLGCIGEAIGMINQDRGAGISGDLSKFPSIIPVRITAKDNTLGKQKDAAVQIINDQALSPALAALSLINIVEKTSDRTGAGTVRVDFEITAGGLPEAIKRQNMYYSPTNTLEVVATELIEAVYMLENNKYHSVDILDVNINVIIDENPLLATIIDVKPQQKKVKSGDKVDIKVKLKPYRGEEIIRTVTYIVPKNQKLGPMCLSVHGGSVIVVPKNTNKQNQNGQSADKDAFKLLLSRPEIQTFEEQIKSFEERDRNNDLIVEEATDGEEELGDDNQLGNQADKTTTEKLGKQANTANKATNGTNEAAKQKKPINGEMRKFHNTTDYIIEGSFPILINIVEK